MIGRPGLAHFILGCPLFPRAARPLALLLDGVRSTEFCHCSGRPICDSHIDPIDSDPLPLPHPVRQPQCPRALVTTLASLDGPSSVLLAGGTKIASAKQQTSQRAAPASRCPRRVGTIISPVSPVSPLTGQRGHISVVGFALGHVGGPLREEVHLPRARVRGERAARQLLVRLSSNENGPDGPRENRQSTPALSRRRGSISTDPNGSSRTPQAPVSPPAECHLDLDGDGPCPSDRQR